MHWLSTCSPSVLLSPGSWYSIFLTPPLSSRHFCALLQDQHHGKHSCKLPSFYIGKKQSISSVFKALTQVVEALDSAPFLVWEVSGPSLSVGTDFTIRLIPGKGFCWNNSISVRDEECDQRDREVPWEIADMGSSSFKDFILRLPVKKLLKKIQLTDLKKAESRSPTYLPGKPSALECCSHRENQNLLVPYAFTVRTLSAFGIWAWISSGSPAGGEYHQPRWQVFLTRKTFCPNFQERAAVCEAQVGRCLLWWCWMWYLGCRKRQNFKHTPLFSLLAFVNRCLRCLFLPGYCKENLGTSVRFVILQAVNAYVFCGFVS